MDINIKISIDDKELVKLLKEVLGKETVQTVVNQPVVVNEPTKREPKNVKIPAQTGKYKPKECALCHEWFNPNSGKQKYCHSCLDKHGALGCKKKLEEQEGGRR